MTKILIVDDEPIFLKVTQVKLEAFGYEVITACHGLEGLKKAEDEKPDLILLDVLMPVMGGYTMLKKVRERRDIKDIPVIMCSGKAILKIAENALKSEADGYLAKPTGNSVGTTGCLSSRGVQSSTARTGRTLDDRRLSGKSR